MSFWSVRRTPDKKPVWSVKPSDLKVESREPGISGFLRVRNEADWLREVVDSHLPYLDEIVIVYNRCTDDTPAIAAEYAQRFPDKVKAVHFEPDVYPQGSDSCKTLPPDSPHSLVNYYNFALCQTRRKFALKLDGDQIGFPRLKDYCDQVRSGVINSYYRFLGINLWDEQGEIYVKGRDCFTFYDRGFFPVSNQTWHALDAERGLEILKTGKLPWTQIEEPLYYHLKGMKRDRGVSNYDLEENKDSRYHGVVRRYWTKFKTSEKAKIGEYIKNNSKFGDILPNPRDLGIRPWNAERTAKLDS